MTRPGLFTGWKLMAHAGQRVGEYVLEREVGQGRFGQVWRAHHHVWTETVRAVKLPTDPDYLRVLHHEGRTLKSLSHPNIVAVEGLDQGVMDPYLVMEYVNGCSLRPLISGRLLDQSCALAVLGQILIGLEHAHGRGIVHRDLKPENVLIDQRAGNCGFGSPGVVKLSDFGFGQSRTLEPTASSILISGSISDESRSLAGTVAYMAPELLGNEEADASCDLYSCGLILFEMLTGRRPSGIESLADPAVPQSEVLDEVFR
jgi:serine/threonine protein kinase